MAAVSRAVPVAGLLMLTTSRTGRIYFTDPQGHKLPDEGETRFSGNVFALTAENGQSGIHITPETGECQWGGEQMDDELSILCMLQLD